MKNTDIQPLLRETSPGALDAAPEVVADMNSLETFLQSLVAEIGRPADDDPIFECPPQALDLLKSDLEEALRYADQEIRVWPFCSVEMRWRRLYEDASILLASSIVLTHAYRSAEANFNMNYTPGNNDNSLTPMKTEKRTAIAMPPIKDTAPLPKRQRLEQTPEDGQWLTETIRLLDMAIIMTLAPQRYHAIRELFERLEYHLRQGWADHNNYHYRDLDIYRPENEERVKNGMIGRPSGKFFNDPLDYREARIRNHPGFIRPSSAAIQSEEPHKPYVLRHAIDHWPALSNPSRCWAKPSYLLRQTFGGRRLVPVELGRAYTDEDWGQKIMPFADFMERWVIKGSEGVNDRVGDTLEDYSIAYLAQHDLLHHIPALRNDIAIPDEVWSYIGDDSAQVSETVSSEEAINANGRMTEPLINTWFGPAGTITPLHTDPYDNILCQVVGKKYVRLYSPKETPRMFPRGKEAHEVQKLSGGLDQAEVDMSNTSSIPVDVVELGAAAVVEEIDEDETDDEDYPTSKFEEFEKAEYFDLVLEEGEALFIPRGWWHYVRSLTTSISVSFWWK